jgi:hypothetical protein
LSSGVWEQQDFVSLFKEKKRYTKNSNNVMQRTAFKLRKICCRKIIIIFLAALGLNSGPNTCQAGTLNA